MKDFDLDRYLRASGRVDLTGLAWHRVAEHPLPAEEARCLTYMMDIETHTVVFLRDLLATRAAHDPEVTAFLSCWVYEELWHGEAFSRFLGEAGFDLGPDREEVWADAPFPSRVGRNSWIRRKLLGKAQASHLVTLLGSMVFRDFVALHMTWGAINELSTLGAYQRLIARTNHPVLVDLLTRIIKDERRHFAFYRAQARMRLTHRLGTARAVRWTLDRLWAPAGTGVRPQRETDFVIAWLFAGNDGRVAAEEMDDTIAQLPGFAGSHLAARARGEAIARMGPGFERMRVAAPLAAFRT
ncbi:MAG: ferritin-like domain-containing protein [Actinobacteria bacterium]|nr:ferritin-like domain-containing protein [Actinomycetota bacterium]